MKLDKSAPPYQSIGRSPSTRREWIEMQRLRQADPRLQGSPSTRREWIEICAAAGYVQSVPVSLHTEGVD